MKSKMKQEYTVIEINSMGDLIKEVNRFLEAGWTLQGGVSYMGRNGHYLQAMVKSIDDE